MSEAGLDLPHLTYTKAAGRSRAQFVVDLERLVCEKISTFNAFNGRVWDVTKIEPADLDGLGRSTPYLLARQWCYFVLRYHEMSKRPFTEIGDHYQRDHTTIQNGHARFLNAVCRWDGTFHVDELQDLCDELRDAGYGSLEIWRIGRHSKRPPPSPAISAVNRDRGKKKTKQQKPENIVVAEYRAARNIRIVAAYEKKRSVTAMSEAFNLSAAQIRSILHTHGNGLKKAGA